MKGFICALRKTKRDCVLVTKHRIVELKKLTITQSFEMNINLPSIFLGDILEFIGWL